MQRQSYAKILKPLNFPTYILMLTGHFKKNRVNPSSVPNIFLLRIKRIMGLISCGLASEKSLEKRTIALPSLRRRGVCEAMRGLAGKRQERTHKINFWKQPTYLHFICLLTDNQNVTECMLVFWTYTNIHSGEAARARHGKNGRIYLKNRAVYKRKGAIYKVYSGGIQLVFWQNTNVRGLLLPTSQRTVGTTHRAVSAADRAVTNVCSMYVRGATYTL